MNKIKFVFKLIRYSLFLLFSPFWYLQLLIPRKNKYWVFGEWFGNKYCDNSRALFEYINKNHPEIKTFWITKSYTVYKELIKQNQNVLFKNSVKSILITLISKYIIISSGKVDIDKFFINGSTLVQLWHGSPIKKIELDDKKSRNLRNEKWKKRFFPFLYEYSYNYLVSTSEVFIPFLSSAFDINESKILVTGYPRNDIFTSKKKTFFIEEIDLKFFSPKKIIYLPTYRTKSSIIDSLRDFMNLNPELNNFLIKTNSIFLYKSHYADKSVLNSSYERIIKIEDDPLLEINKIMKDCDILITDYSGAYFDFELTGKPVILAPFDFDNYLKEREIYWDYYNDFSASFASNWQEVIEIIDAIFSNRIGTVNSSLVFNSFNDGNNCKRLFARLITQ